MRLIGWLLRGAAFPGVQATPHGKQKMVRTLASAERGGPSAATLRAQGTTTLRLTELQSLAKGEGGVGLNEGRNDDNNDGGEELELHADGRVRVVGGSGVPTTPPLIFRLLCPAGGQRPTRASKISRMET